MMASVWSSDTVPSVPCGTGYGICKRHSDSSLKSVEKKDRKQMKKCIIPILIVMLTSLPLYQTLAGDTASLVEDFPTVQAYTDEPVEEEDILSIVNAGINSPSGMNNQPWHFSVVSDPEILEMIASEGDMSSATRAGITDAPLAIVISCAEGSEYDAGLTTMAMSIEAQLLGYGSKIFTSVRPTLNGERKEEFREILQIPEGMYAMAVLIIGKEDTDAVSSATGRDPIEDVVSFIEP